MTNSKNAKILVVDDEAEIRRVVKMLLQRVPGIAADVVEAGSAEEGMERLAGAPFDLVISDFRMPGKTGVDLLENALARQPGAKRVLITAHGELDIGVAAINRGRVDGIMRKPWDNAAFTALVGSLLVPPSALPPSAPEAPAPPAGPAPSRSTIEAEVAEVTKSMQKLRVRLGLGSISPEGYQRATEDLARKRAMLESQLSSL